MAQAENKMSASKSDQLSDTVADLLDSVFCDVDSTAYDQEVDYIINKHSLNSQDPKLCPRAVNLETETPKGIKDSFPGHNPDNCAKTNLKSYPQTDPESCPKTIPTRRSQGDTQIDEVGQQSREEEFGNVSPPEYLPDDSCPLYFRSEDTTGHESEDSFETLDIRNMDNQQYKPSGYEDEFSDEAIKKLKRELLGECSEEDDPEELSIPERSVLSSPILDQLKSPKKIASQERQNILNTLIHGVEKRVRDQHNRNKPNLSEVAAENKVKETNASNRTQSRSPERSGSPGNKEEEVEAYLEEGTSHIRESLLSVLEALKYIFQSAQPESEESGGTEEPPGSPVEGEAVSQETDSRNHFTQTSPRLGKMGEERVDADLFIAGLHEEFQKCLWLHQKLTEEAHQLGFDRGIQNTHFLQELIDQGVQMIWSLREERRQLEKYMKDKERDWSTMSRGLTQELIDLRRENVQLLTAFTSKDGGRAARRTKSYHIKSLLKSKHELEKAFCLNVEKQDKINELKLLVLQQQKCIRSLQERLIEEQATAMVLRHRGADSPEGDPPTDHNQNDTHADVGQSRQQQPQENDPNDKDATKERGPIKGSNSRENADLQNSHDSTDIHGACFRGPPSPDPLRVEEMVKLQDVLYCDHGNFGPDQPQNPEIAAMQVYSIGGEGLCNAATNTSPRFNMLDLKYVSDIIATETRGQDLGQDNADTSKAEARKLACGDVL